MENDTNLIKRVVNELERFGIQKNLSGYTFIRKAVLLAYNDFGIVQEITHRLYPTIAETHDSTPSKVERCIRHAIDMATFTSNGLINATFGRKPTNGQFIAEIADGLRVEDGII
jgi:Sporulation initiation factor Spo0A C terminal.